MQVLKYLLISFLKLLWVEKCQTSFRQLAAEDYLRLWGKILKFGFYKNLKKMCNFLSCTNYEGFFLIFWQFNMVNLLSKGTLRLGILLLRKPRVNVNSSPRPSDFQPGAIRQLIAVFKSHDGSVAKLMRVAVSREKIC